MEDTLNREDYFRDDTIVIIKYNQYKVKIMIIISYFLMF